MNRTLSLSSRLALAALALALPAAGCATLKAAVSGGGTVTTEQIAERNKALDAAMASLAACGPKSQATDVGLLAVSAGPDGKVVVDAAQWTGSEDSKACVLAEAAKIQLPAWAGPTVSDVWAVGTQEHPAPPMVDKLPGGMQSQLQSFVSAANDAETGPTAACAQRNLSNDAYAVVSMRVFIFSDGKVVGATPWGIAGEGRDVGFINCVRDFMVKDWKFDSFGKEGFTMTQVSLQRGVDTTNK